MLLAIDVGNTNIVFGIYKNDKLIETFRLTTKENRTIDELGLLMLQYFSCFNLQAKAVEAVVISSVVPGGMPTLTRAIRKYVGQVPLVVDRDLFPAIRYESEETLGADRSVSCHAALAKYGGPVIVLDLGTATTLDAISETGWYLGGCILAGMKVSADALTNQTAQLPPIELLKPNTVLGYNTIEQIQIGSVSGYLGGIDYLVRETKREIGYEGAIKVIATGGFAGLAAAQLQVIDAVEEHLILEGLRMLYEKHKESQAKG